MTSYCHQRRWCFWNHVYIFRKSSEIKLFDLGSSLIHKVPLCSLKTGYNHWHLSSRIRPFSSYSQKKPKIEKSHHSYSWPSCCRCTEQNQTVSHRPDLSHCDFRERTCTPLLSPTGKIEQEMRLLSKAFLLSRTLALLHRLTDLHLYDMYPSPNARQKRELKKK